MVQFLSINFFSWISSIFVGFFKSSRFLCDPVCYENPHLANPKETAGNVRGAFVRQSTNVVRNMASQLEFPENKNNSKK